MPAVARKAAVDTVACVDGTPGTICPNGQPRCDAPSTQATAAGSPDVFVMGIGVVRIGDPMLPHKFVPCGCPVHAPPLTVASAHVYANGLRIGRIGDLYTGGHVISSGAPTVFDGSPQA